MIRSDIKSLLYYNTCEALWTVLQPRHMSIPTEEVWLDIAKVWQRWDFPHCIGTIDGKHVNIKAPNGSGSDFFNYKKFFSIVMMVVSDTRYHVILLDVGESGHNNDAGIFGRSDIGISLTENTLNIPDKMRVPGVLSTTTPGVLQNRPILPYVIVGDEAFPLKTYLMRPYSGNNLETVKRIFNYHLSRARRIVGKVFGILAVRFRFYLRMMFANPETIKAMVKATCELHTFLRDSECLQPARERQYCPPNFVNRE